MNVTQKEVDAQMFTDDEKVGTAYASVLHEAKGWLQSRRHFYYIASQDKYTEFDTQNNVWRWYPPGGAFKITGLAGKGARSAFDSACHMMGRIKDDIVMSFEKQSPNLLNTLSTSYWLQPKEGPVHPVFDILLRSLAGGDQKGIEHLEQVIAWKYMKPADYLLPCIAMAGEGGSGKNTFVEDVLMTIFGQSQVVVLGTDEAFGSFNGQMLGKAIVFIDEAITDKTDSESLKRKVGNKTININVKYGFQGTLPNTIRGGREN